MTEHAAHLSQFRASEQAQNRRLMSRSQQMMRAARGDMSRADMSRRAEHQASHFPTRFL